MVTSTDVLFFQAKVQKNFTEVFKNFPHYNPTRERDISSYFDVTDDPASSVWLEREFFSFVRKLLKIINNSDELT